ncbi:diacylglycerol kinase eta isoform X2 [Harmonia axyridis]|uniref:diacylglycerol kinase eta isoform X2 n=1 Tax=Harmonia axyridis TaxID=115357 RepID=UPI001E279543|nr:diacylglycerol kinase eta isoform X2 [Harmonia axyridis]
MFSCTKRPECLHFVEGGCRMAGTSARSAKYLGRTSPVPEESSESEGETGESVQATFHRRRLSTNREIRRLATIKEGYLLKQTSSFQRWGRRYFKLKGRSLYYAKDSKAVIFDEIELNDLCLAECSTKNVNHSFQVITPYRSLVLCAESRREMEEWLAAFNTSSQTQDQADLLSGRHHWYATSHARPIYCNVCRDALGGVTSHGLSCELCKCKVHKKCATKALNNCKWTTLASIGINIIEESDGNLTMPHQWIEGNLPVSAKCQICDKTCGSVLRLQDWRCLWCRATVHTQCRPALPAACPLGPARVSVVPPTALHSIQDESWEGVRPLASSPLLVFVNSKSGDNQGVKFLRRFKQLLNPAQVFDLISTGPRLGLTLFRPFDPFRILVCSGDGSVGWVLSEIDKLGMHNQCQVAVLPLGTGNDLARVLGWGSSCDDDAHLPQLLERYEQASTKMLDRWSILAYERTIAMPKLSLIPGQLEEQLHSQITQYEENLLIYIQNILQSDETTVIVNSAKRLCETVRNFIGQVNDSPLTKGDEGLGLKCEALQQKLVLLLQNLTCGQIDFTSGVSEENKSKDDTDSEISFDKARTEKSEKDLSNTNFRKHRRTSRFVEREKDALLIRANSLKRAIRHLVESTEKVVSDQASKRMKHSSSDDFDKQDIRMDQLQVKSNFESGSSSDLSSCPSPTSSIVTARLASLSPMPELRRDSTLTDTDVYTLPVPPDFADSRRASQIKAALESCAMTETILTEACSSLKSMEEMQHQRRNSEPPKPTEKRPSLPKVEVQKSEKESEKNQEDSSLMSTISNEEASITSEILDQKSFCPRKDSDGEDLNGHIGHIDSPETDTFPNSDPLLCESIMDDISSMLGEVMYGYEQESMENTATDDTSLFALERRRSIKRDSLERHKKSSKPKPEDEETVQFGFENRAFMTYPEPKKYCSLARFNEGNDIDRKSFKRAKTGRRKSEGAKENRQNMLNEETEARTPKSSHGSLNKMEKELSNLSNKTLIALEVEKSSLEMEGKFPQINVIVEPPSPILSDVIRNERLEKLRVEIEVTECEEEEERELKSLQATIEKLSTSDLTSNASSNSNLLGIDNENFMTRSPAATRRISCCSMLNPTDAALLAAAAAATTKFQELPKREEKQNRRMPIINPMVTLPTWPNITNAAGGFISKCLLANADTLCAAVSPLIDPDDSFKDGYYEKAVMNNYFGIGIDAKISLDFHHKREEHPEKCRSRAKNYMWYGVLGSKQFLQKTYKNLDQRIQIECDGQRIPLPSLQGIVILNIPSFMGGINFWGGTKEDDIFLAPSFDDKILEVVAVFGSVQMAASRLINLQRHRIAQCHSVQINILGDDAIPIQVDGEAWVQPPGVVRIIHKNRMQMLCRNRSLENSLRLWGEKQRQSIAAQGKTPRSSISHDKSRSSLTRQSMPSQEKSYLGVDVEKNRQHSFSGAVPVQQEKRHTVTFQEKPVSPPEPDVSFSEDEHQLLIIFIECATTLTKWIKLLAISHPLEADLYSLATNVDACLENIHPNGKLLEGPTLRLKFTELVNAVKQLYEDSCCLLHDRSDKLKLKEDMESKLSVSLANTELELRKCMMMDHKHQGSLVYLQPLQEDSSEHKKKGLFWLKFKAKGHPSHSKPAREVAHTWGTQEVATWLETLQLSEYIDSFIKNDIRGRELLSLARRDLKELGVTKVGHVKRILQAIKDLSSQGA